MGPKIARVNWAAIENYNLPHTPEPPRPLPKPRLVKKVAAKSAPPSGAVVWTNKVAA